MAGSVGSGSGVVGGGVVAGRVVAGGGVVGGGFVAGGGVAGDAAGLEQAPKINNTPTSGTTINLLILILAPSWQSCIGFL